MRTQDSQSSLHWWWRRKAMSGSSGYTCSTPPDTSHWCLSIVHSAERDCIYIYVRFLDEHHMTSASRAPGHVIISTYMVTFSTYLPYPDQQLYGQLVGHCILWYTECVWCMQSHFSSVRAQRQGKINEKGRETKSRNPCLLPLETFLPIFVVLLLQVEPTHNEASYLFVICSFFSQKWPSTTDALLRTPTSGLGNLSTGIPLESVEVEVKLKWKPWVQMENPFI